MHLSAFVEEVSRFMGRSPALARDLLAVGLVMTVLAATGGLPRIELSLAILPLAGVIFAIAMTLGRGSAVFAALLALLLLRAKEQLAWRVVVETGEMLVAGIGGIAMAVVAERIRQYREDAARAHEWAALSSRQTSRVGPTWYEPGRPPGTLAARSHVAPSRAGSEGADALAQAFRSEGGV
jgi:hypothetical protein